MDEQFLRKLSQKTDQIRELSKIEHKTPNEKKELDQAVKDLDQLVDTIKDSKELDQLNTLIDYCVNYPDQDGKTLEEMFNQLDWREKHMSYLEYRQKQRDLLEQENELKIRLDIRERQQKIDEMKGKLDELDKEDQYITTKKDKDGLYKIKEEKYQQKLKQLRLKYDDAQTKTDKLNALGNLLNLKMVKGMKYFNNGMIKTSKGIASVTKQIGNVSQSFDEISNYSGYKKTSRTSSKTKKKGKKKGKKSKSKPTKDYNNNYGFNEKNVFDV